MTFCLHFVGAAILLLLFVIIKFFEQNLKINSFCLFFEDLEIYLQFEKRNYFLPEINEI